MAGGPCGAAMCSCQAVSLDGVSITQPKVNPPVISFDHCPIAVQTQGAISGKPIIIWRELRGPAWPLLPLLMCLCLRKKAPCPRFPACLCCCLSAAKWLIFTCNVQFCVGFKGNFLPTFRQESELSAAICLSHFASLFLAQKHKHESKRRAFACLVFSFNSPGWTPCCGDNLHFDWCSLEVSTWLLREKMHWKNNTE